jgi:lipoyl(octanoyl) transferase
MITITGFALNMNADLGCFDDIISCEIRGKAVKTVNSKLGAVIVDYDEVKMKLLKYFEVLFEAHFT